MTELRIVSLVPSITELLFDLGLGAQVVGRTGFCIHPWEQVRTVTKVGGTKDLKFEVIAELRPTHVIVNIDENRREDAEALAEFVPEVVVTHPLTPRDNLALYRQLGTAFGVSARAEELCAEFEVAYAALSELRAARATEPVLYLIWREPWMTVAPQTYISAMLDLVGWQTLPRQSTERYPEIDPAAHAGEVAQVLLSSEPFHFKAHHLDEVRALVPGAEVSLIDGEMISWYGSRAIAGLSYLAGLAQTSVRA
jgi:ABC-type Fe3+-hydroxamate transport system substrate-binding protein